MFKNITTDADDRGQVGIGTLIVFIALVLVAAIAAGVLINTAGFLQTQAEQTGQESTEQVSSGVQVFSTTSVVGENSAQSDDIQVLELRVGLSAGSDPVDLTSATVQWVGEADTATFSVTSGSGGDVGAYFDQAAALTDSSNAVIPGAEDEVLNDPADRTSLIIFSGSASGISHGGTDQLTNDLPLEAGDDATIRITTQNGAQTTVEISVPRVLSDGQGISL